MSWARKDSCGMDIKTPLKRLRENPIAGTLIRSPFRLLRAAGFALPNSIYKHLPFHGAFVLHHPAGSDFRMMSYGYELENNLYWEGLSGWEPECIQPWIRFATEAREVIDIGANTGFFALLAAATGARPRLHAFEPTILAELLSPHRARLVERIVRLLGRGYEL